MRALTPEEFRELDFNELSYDYDPEVLLELTRRGYFVHQRNEESPTGWAYQRTDQGRLAVRVHKAALAAGLVL